ncbi:MAG: triphosphoribosyl-dephospho-CoA synthase [Gammaproteobacteria bacterium]|nr:triphosphoribosyl-dephospho-CoA synthase [Gammaproteobacteria bacterium]MBA3730791.1 triphosphoribosyl-dephospho-CoA synthase [Gammaproteobacteria bacterium]
MAPPVEASRVSPQMLKDIYLRACEIDLRALKPGNVGVDAPGHGMFAADFTASAQASVAALTAPTLAVGASPSLGERPGLGERIYRAVAATREKVACNTNLGIVLLCAPLLHAMQPGDAPASGLRAALREVLNGAGVDDTRWIYHAIRLASPGGLGTSPTHDVAREPEVTVIEAMRTAAHRDRIAWQYSSGYADIFDYALPALSAFRARWGSDEWAASGIYLGLLRRFPDSHVARKYGEARAMEVSRMAAPLEAALMQCNAPQEILQRLQRADAEFKRAGINPGTTADLTVATLVASHLEQLLSTDSRNLSLYFTQRAGRKSYGLRAFVKAAGSRAVGGAGVSPDVSCNTITCKE